MTRIPSKYEHQKKFWALSSIVSSLVAVYVILVGLTVWNTLIRQRSEKDITLLQDNVSELEFSYVNLKSSINIEMARTLGYVDSPEFVVVKSNSDVAISR